MAKAAERCPECKGEKKGRGFSHKVGCKLAGKKKGSGERLAALTARLSGEEKEIAHTLATENTRDVLLLAATLAKKPPARVSTETLWSVLADKGISGEKLAAIKAALTAS